MCFFLCSCVSRHVFSQCKCASQKTSFGTQFSHFPQWVQELNLLNSLANHYVLTHLVDPQKC